MEAPPTYDYSQKYNPGQESPGDFPQQQPGPPNYVQQQPGAPPVNYAQQQPGAPPANFAQQPGPPGVYVQPGYSWNRGPMGMFGKDPLTTVCPNCQANVSESLFIMLV